MRYRLNARAFPNRRFIVQQYNPKAVANWQHWYPDEWTDMLLLEAAYTRGPQYWHDRFHTLADMTGTRAILDELERDGFFISQVRVRILSGTLEKAVETLRHGASGWSENTRVYGAQHPFQRSLYDPAACGDRLLHNAKRYKPCLIENP